MTRKKTKRNPDHPAWLTPARFKRLGTVPDTHIADAAGVHRSTVARWRRKLGIRAWCPGRQGLF